MKLVSYTAVRKAMGFDAGVQQEAIESAIDRATEIVAVDVRVPSFERKTYTDRFYVTRSDCLEYAYGTYLTRLALAAGFVVSPLTSATVTAAGGTAAMVSTESYALTYDLDGVKGELVCTQDLRDCFVDVTYSAGFEAEETDATLLNQAQVPGWLQQMALLQALILLDSTNPTLRHEKTRDASDAVKQNREAYTAILSGRVRYFPRAVYPR